MKASTLVMILAVGVVLSGSAFAAEESGAKETADTAAGKPALVLESEDDKLCYAIGMQIVKNLLEHGRKVNPEALCRAVQDLMVGRQTSLTVEEATQTVMKFRAEMRNAQRKRSRERPLMHAAKSDSFLRKNTTKPGVVVLPSGLQYKVLEEGTGRKPTAKDRVKIHYRGTLIDGKEFDNSHSRGEPTEVAVGGVIKGWTEALQLMKEGAKWQLFVPPALAYGSPGRPPTIPPSSALIFEMELIEVIPSAEPE